MTMFYISIQLRFPLRCFALGLRPSFIDEDLFPPLFVPLPPFLFLRPFRSLRVRSFYNKIRFFIFLPKKKLILFTYFRISRTRV